MSEHLPENAALIGPDGESRLVKSAEDIVAAMRAITTAFLDGLDERRERIADDIADLHDGCPGPLKMRAEKAGQLVTVTVCMSPNAPTDQATEETIVQREPKSNP
jgi:hypothetical protein